MAGTARESGQRVAEELDGVGYGSISSLGVEADPVFGFDRWAGESAASVAVPGAVPGVPAVVGAGEVSAGPVHGGAQDLAVSEAAEPPAGGREVLRQPAVRGRAGAGVQRGQEPGVRGVPDVRPGEPAAAAARGAREQVHGPPGAAVEQLVLVFRAAERADHGRAQDAAGADADRGAGRGAGRGREARGRQAARQVVPGARHGHQEAAVGLGGLVHRPEQPAVPAQPGRLYRPGGCGHVAAGAPGPVEGCLEGV